MSRKYLMNLHIFDDPEGNQTGNATGQNGGSNGSSGATFTFDQLNEIAASRAERAERSALTNFFQQQGLTEAEAKQAFEKFKADKAAAAPDVSAIEKERDGYKAQIEQMQNNQYLMSKGVKQEDMDYVAFKVNAGVKDGVDFKKSADKFLKDNPRFTGQTYRMSGSSGANSSGAVPASTSINDAIRRAAGR